MRICYDRLSSSGGAGLLSGDLAWSISPLDARPAHFPGHQDVRIPQFRVVLRLGLLDWRCLLFARWLAGGNNCNNRAHPVKRQRVAANFTVNRTRRFMLSTLRASARRAGYLQR